MRIIGVATWATTALFTLSLVSSVAVATSSKPVLIRDNAGLDSALIAKATKNADDAFRLLEAFLGKEPKNPVVVEINDRRFGPRAYAEKMLVDMPASRLTGKSFTPRHWQVFRRRGTAIVSEIVRVSAPRQYPGYGYLPEIGLGVHLHAVHFGRRDPSWPDMGDTLVNVIARYLAELAPSCIRRFKRVARIVSEQGTPFSAERVVAFAQAGSFVEYLLEVFGRSKFRDFYNSPTASFESVFGKPISQLESEWMDWLNTKLPRKTKDSHTIVFCESR